MFTKVEVYALVYHFRLTNARLSFYYIKLNAVASFDLLIFLNVIQKFTKVIAFIFLLRKCYGFSNT